MYVFYNKLVKLAYQEVDGTQYFPPISGFVFPDKRGWAEILTADLNLFLVLLT